MSIKQQDRVQRDEINRQIEQIGDVYGAQNKFFEREELANGHTRYHRRLLAGEGGSGCFGVCLCCVRLSEELVVLLNGDRRTASRVVDCPICAPHYNLAGRVSDAIYDGQCAGLIDVNGKTILTDDSFTLKL